MIELPEKMERAISYLTKVPGVGEKTAFRYMMNIMKWSELERDEFAKTIENLSNVGHCSDCGAYTQDQVTLCHVCQNVERQSLKVICVVEKFTDMMAIENSGRFNGLFHILGGVLNPLAGVGPGQLRVHQLVDRVKDWESGSLIFAINPSVEGDATCSFLKELIPEKVKLERIGFGVPIGGSLEYLDPMTITKALENKQLF